MKSDTGPSPSTAPATKRDTWPPLWNVTYNERSNKCHHANSPNIAPATQNDRPTSGRNLRKTAETPFPTRSRSEHDPSRIRAGPAQDPRPFPSVRNPPRNRGWTFCIEKYNISHSAHLSKFHQVLRLPRKVTLDLHQVLHLPRKVTLDLHQVTCHEKWHWTFTKYCTCHEKWHWTFTKYCTCHEKGHVTFTKCCTCHEKWHWTFTKYLNLLLSTITKRFCFLTLLLLSDFITWLYY